MNQGGKPRFFRLTTLNQLDEIPNGAVIGARRGPDYVAVSYEMTEDCVCETCKNHFGTIDRPPQPEKDLG